MRLLKDKLDIQIQFFQVGTMCSEKKQILKKISTQAPFGFCHYYLLRMKSFREAIVITLHSALDSIIKDQRKIDHV